MEANVRIYKDQMAALNKEPAETVVSAAAAQKNEKLLDTEHQIEALENQLSILRQHYKDTYPDVQTVMGRLDTLKKRRDDLLAEENEKKADAPAPVLAVTKPTESADRARDARLGRHAAARPERD